MTQLTDDLAPALDALQAAIDQVESGADALNAAMGDLVASIAAHECEDGGPPPEPPATTMWVGASADAGHASGRSYEQVATACGGLETIRSFSSPGKMPTNLSQTAAASSVGKRLIVHSFKGRYSGINDACRSLAEGRDDSWLNSFMNSKPADQGLHLIFRHEPDEENADTELWADAQEHFRDLVDQANARGADNGWTEPILFGANFMSYSARTNPARIERLAEGMEELWDFISWDGYSEVIPSDTAEHIFGKCILFNQAHANLPFAIGEFGQDGTPNTDREAFILDVCEYAHDNGALWVHYWNAIIGDNNYVLGPDDERVLGAQS